MEKDNTKLENLLALILINSLKGSTMAEKALYLNRAGFTNLEIADFLETKSSSISQLLYEKRKAKKK